MPINYPIALQQRFEQDIVSGKWGPGSRVAGPELADFYDSPPLAMQSVLLIAQRKGLVRPKNESGFEILGITAQGPDSVFTHTAKAGLKPSSVVRQVTAQPADPQTAEKLRLPVGAPVYQLERTRLINGETLANHLNLMPVEICPELAQDDLSRASFQKLLEEKYFAFTASIEESFSIVPANQQDARILDLPQGNSILQVERMAYSVTAWPLVWTLIRIHPARYQYVAQLWPEGAALLTKAGLPNV